MRIPKQDITIWAWWKQSNQLGCIQSADSYARALQPLGDDADFKCELPGCKISLGDVAEQ